MDRKAQLYRTIWRWHFYAGLFVIPFMLILSVSGALFLFKPQIERWEERRFQNLPVAGAVTPDIQLDRALATYPGAAFQHYRLPEDAGDAALIAIRLATGERREVFVSPQGKVLGALDPEARIIAIDRRIHGQLMIGRQGSWLVELAASWAIVMVVTGLYLWWPRGRAAAGVVWPRMSRGRGVIWRDLHAVTGFWVSGLALVLLLTGLPWADAWGSGFKAVRAELGLMKQRQDWSIGGRPAEGDHMGHDHGAMVAMEAAGIPGAPLSEIVAKAQARNLAFPVLVQPPGEAMVWTVKSDAQNRPLRETITYDMMTGAELSHERFSERHVIDQVIGYGIAWHEGQLFGWVNQIVGLLTAIALVLLPVSGLVLWRRRRPEQLLGAPPLPADPVRLGGVAVIVLALALVLPMLAASLTLLALFDRLLLPKLPGFADWLGVRRRRAPARSAA